MAQTSNSTPLINSDTEKRILALFCEQFYLTATFQGRTAYLLMSIHAVNPNILKSLFRHIPDNYIFANMVYGLAIMIYSRPAMIPISRFNRVMFSIMGSLMFNHSSMLVFNWLAKHISQDRPYLLTFLGFLSGRVMMLHLLAYLYHVDSRFRGFHLRTSSEFESMYRY